MVLFVPGVRICVFVYYGDLYSPESTVHVMIDCSKSTCISPHGRAQSTDYPAWNLLPHSTRTRAAVPPIARGALHSTPSTGPVTTLSTATVAMLSARTGQAILGSYQ